jgi:quinol-cytochrome oxidoreductase complex cytochrome b subunit
MEKLRGSHVLWKSVCAPVFIWLEEAGSHRLLLTRASRFTLGFVGKYATKIVVPYFRASSVLGYLLLLTIVAQMYSGFLLALFYLPDPSFVISLRLEFFAELWWYVWLYRMHVVGVDLLFVFSYAHVLKKIYLRNFGIGDVDGWLTGAYAFLLYHLVVFLGITLSTNHLGDVTVTIAANIF